MVNFACTVASFHKERYKVEGVRVRVCVQSFGNEFILMCRTEDRDCFSSLTTLSQGGNCRALRAKAALWLKHCVVRAKLCHRMFLCFGCQSKSRPSHTGPIPLSLGWESGQSWESYPFGPWYPGHRLAFSAGDASWTTAELPMIERMKDQSLFKGDPSSCYCPLLSFICYSP